jgi:1-deoxy-D-xylulose-5-phosphate reductoisomerase
MNPSGRKRIAVVGATGSIGRQALDVIGANRDLTVCALASWSQPLEDLAEEHRVEHAQVGGDVTELLERAEPDLVLNAIVGFAGVGATLWTLERGITLALANKESLVAAGHAPQTVESLVLTASGGPLRNRTRAGLE